MTKKKNRNKKKDNITENVTANDNSDADNLTLNNNGKNVIVVKVSDQASVDSKNGKDTACSLCQNQDSTTCSNCSNIPLCSYCTALHIRNGRCLPWTVSDTGGGRVLVATRIIKPLEIVVQDTAIVVAPTGKVSCLGCGRSVNCLYNCSDCGLPLCGTNCPRIDCHRDQECPLLSPVFKVNGLPSITETDKNHPLLLLVGCIRLLLVKTQNPACWRQMSGLVCNIEKLLTNSTTTKEQLKAVKDLGLKVLPDISEEEVDQAFGLLKMYGYNLPDIPDGKVRCLFPVKSLVSHSCLSNMQYIEREGGRKIVLQAVTKIEKGDLLTVRYTPYLQGRITLTRWLSQQRFIRCDCARCSDATELRTFTSSAICDQKDCTNRGGLLLPVDTCKIDSDWICCSCQKIVSQCSVESLEEEYISKFHQLPQGDLQAYYRYLNELGDRFHASHHLVMRMAQFIVLLQGKRLESLSRERIETQAMLCDKLLDYNSRLDPGATHSRAKLLLEKNKAELNLAKLDCQEGKISRKIFMERIKEGVKVEVNAKKMMYFKWEDSLYKH